MSELAVGAPAPAFSLPDQIGKTISLADLDGPDGGPLFLPEGRHARLHGGGLLVSRQPRLRGERRCVLGISPDSVDSHAKFAEKFYLPFPLLADDGHKIAEAYGVWVEKSMYGKKYMGVERSTFVIDGTGQASRRSTAR